MIVIVDTNFFTKLLIYKNLTLYFIRFCYRFQVRGMAGLPLCFVSISLTKVAGFRYFFNNPLLYFIRFGYSVARASRRCFSTLRTTSLQCPQASAPPWKYQRQLDRIAQGDRAASAFFSSASRMRPTRLQAECS